MDWCILNVAIDSIYVLKTDIFNQYPLYFCYYKICSLISLRRKGISPLFLKLLYMYIPVCSYMYT